MEYIRRIVDDELNKRKEAFNAIKTISSYCDLCERSGWIYN